MSGGSGYGAAFAAGWPDDSYGWFRYWTGQAYGTGNARIVYLNDGFESWDSAEHDYPFAVCLP